MVAGRQHGARCAERDTGGGAVPLPARAGRGQAGGRQEVPVLVLGFEAAREVLPGHGFCDLERHVERVRDFIECIRNLLSKTQAFLTIGSSIVSFGERERFRKLLWASEFENQYLNTPVAFAFKSTPES